MPDERGSEVLRGARTLALGDEPLAGGVEYAALEVRVELTDQNTPYCDELRYAVSNNIRMLAVIQRRSKE